MYQDPQGVRTDFEGGTFSVTRDGSGIRFGARLNDAVDKIENWPTPRANDEAHSTPDQEKSFWHRQKRRYHAEVVMEVVIADTLGLHAPENPSTTGKSREYWPTPRSCSAMAANISPAVANDPKRLPNLETIVGKCLGRDMTRMGQSAKLNPSWVEQLMGLPVNWTQLPTEWIGSD